MAELSPASTAKRGREEEKTLSEVADAFDRIRNADCKDTERCKEELLPELASLAALAQEKLDALWQIVQQAPPATKNDVQPEAAQTPELAKSLQALPGWCRAAFRATVPDSYEQQLGSLRTLSVIVSGFVMLGLDVTVRDKEMQNKETVGIVNISWRTVVALLSHKAICETAGHISPAEESSPDDSADNTEQEADGGQLLLSTGTELEDILDILLRVSALAFCSAASARGVGPSEERAATDTAGYRPPQPQPEAPPSKGQPASLATFRNRLLVAKFLQNNAIRLAVLYPRALLVRSAALLVSFTAVLSSSLDLDSGFLTKEHVDVLSTVLGGKLHGLLMHMLSKDISLQLVHYLCSFQHLPARPPPSAPHTRADRAAAYGASVCQLETMASFQASDSLEEDCADVPLPSAPEGQLWTLAAVLDGARQYPLAVLEALVAALPGAITAMEDPRLSGALTALFSLPSFLAQGKENGQGKGNAAPGPATLFQLLSGGLQSLTAAVMAAASLPHLADGRSLGQEGMRLWMALQRFLFEVATHPHPVLADLVLGSWEIVAAHAHPSLPEHHINLLFALLQKASTLDTFLEAAKADDSGKGSGKGGALSDVHQGATGQAVSSAAGLTLLRLSRLTAVLLASCPPSSLRKSLPPFLRQAVGVLKRGGAPSDAAVAVARMLLALLQAGCAEVLFRRSRDDFTSLLSSLVQVASQLLDSRVSHSREEGFGRSAALLGPVLDCISELASSCMEPTPQGSAITQLASRAVAAQRQAQEGSHTGHSARPSDGESPDGAPSKKRRFLPQEQALAGPTLNLVSSIRRNPVLRETVGNESAVGSSADIECCVKGIQLVLTAVQSSGKGLDKAGAQGVDAFLRFLPSPVSPSAAQWTWQPGAAQCLRSIAALGSAPACVAARHSAASCGILLGGASPERTAGASASATPSTPSVLAALLGMECAADGSLPGAHNADRLRVRWEELWGDSGRKTAPVAAADAQQWLQGVLELGHEPHRVREARGFIRGALQAYHDMAEAEEALAEQTQPHNPGPADAARAEGKHAAHVQSQLPAPWGDRRASLEQPSMNGATGNGAGGTAAGQGRGEKGSFWGASAASAREGRESGRSRDRDSGGGGGGGDKGAVTARRENAGVVEHMDDAVRALEAALEAAQGSEVGSGAWEKMHERVQEAESVVKRLKSMCRRHSMQ